MSTLTLGARIDTRAFFMGMGVTDTLTLDELAYMFGGLGSHNQLSSLRDTILYACVGNRAALLALIDPEGRADAAESRFGALADQRRFGRVETRVMIGRYLPEPADSAAATLLGLLGATVHEWFFPALVMLSRKSGNINMPQWRASFQRDVTELVKLAGDIAGDAPEDRRRVAAVFTSRASVLRSAHLDTQDKFWVLPASLRGRN